MSRLPVFMEFIAPAVGLVGCIYGWYQVSSYQKWMGALNAGDAELYPVVPHRSVDLRIVGQEEVPVESQNIGLRVQGPIINDSETVVLYRLLKEYATAFGSPMNSKYVASTRKMMADEGLNPHILDGALVCSPLMFGATGFAPAQKLWGVGDKLRHHEVPLELRSLADSLRKTHTVNIGALRHIIIEYFPSGVPYIAPRQLPPFSGYDYMIMGLRAPKHRQEPLVVSATPSQRSKSSSIGEVAKQSWTNVDWDAKLERGCVLHIFGQARFQWRFGIRPCQWFGSPREPVAAKVAALLEQRTRGAPDTNTIVAPTIDSRPWWKRMLGKAGEAAHADSELVSSAALTTRTYCPDDLADDDGVVLLTLVFEGAHTKERTYTSRPERFYYGVEPPPERTLWDDEGRTAWRAKSWSEIRSWNDLMDSFAVRMKAARSRQFS